MYRLHLLPPFSPLLYTGVEISLPADTFTCSPDITCNSDETCEIVYQITQDKVTIHSDQQSFVSLLAKPQEKCVCHGSTCVNPCSTNPCPRHKVCRVTMYSKINTGPRRFPMLYAQELEYPTPRVCLEL